MARSRQMRPETLFFPKGLMDRLAAIKRYPLTLLEAPSGFGKTTSLRHFFDAQVSPAAQVIWRTLPSESPHACWKTFCAAVGSFDADAAGQLAAAGPPDEDTLPEIREIFKELHCPEETHLVLDDFAAWKLEDAFAFLSALSEQGGKRLHITVASQILTKKTQCGLLPNNRFLMLRETLLTFSPRDIDAYYRQAGISLTGAQLEEVERITGGWIMALYLQLLSFMETGRFEEGGMPNLMHNTLWNRLPEREREFLMSVSIFPRFSLTQAAALSGLSRAETELLLQEKRVFVHFDRETRHFYLHALFQDFLAAQLALLPEEKQRAIYLAGGELAEQSGDRVNTLRFYYLSGEWERLLSLPLTSFEIADVVDEHTKPMILDIMERTPFEIKRKYPAAMVPLAFTLFFLHETQKLLAMKEEIGRVIAESDISQSQKDVLAGEMELLLSFLEYNRIDAMSERHRRALALLGGPASLINVKSTWTFGSPSVLYMFWRETGKLEEELAQMDDCMPFYYTLTAGHGSGADSMMRAEACLLRGETEEAEIFCHKAMFTADSKRQNSIYQCGLFLLARIALLRGEDAMLQNALLSLEERSRQNTEDLCRYTLDLAKGFLFLLLRRSGEVAPWLAEGEISDRRLVIMTQPFAHILYGRMLLERGEYQKLLGVSEFALGISSIFPNLLPQVYIRLYRAQALEALGKQSQAMENLNSALDTALPDGILLPFAENYKGIRHLLSSVQREDGAAQKIAALSQQLEKGLASLVREETPLSPREREVLELLREGLTNPAIAERLGVSLSTVKATVSNVLSKKGVTSRELLKQKKNEK